MKIRWIGLADKSFEDEIDFIIRKWNTEQAVAFTSLVEDFLKLLKENPYLGKVSDYKEYRQFVLSTQTKIWYQVNEKKKTIFIVFFWNNKRDPIDLKKYLK